MYDAHIPPRQPLPVEWLGLSRGLPPSSWSRLQLPNILFGPMEVNNLLAKEPKLPPSSRHQTKSLTHVVPGKPHQSRLALGAKQARQSSPEPCNGEPLAKTILPKLGTVKNKRFPRLFGH